MEKDINLSSVQRSVIIGSLLGDAYCGGTSPSSNRKLQFAQSSKEYPALRAPHSLLSFVMSLFLLKRVKKVELAQDLKIVKVCGFLELLHIQFSMNFTSSFMGLLFLNLKEELLTKFNNLKLF